MKTLITSLVLLLGFTTSAAADVVAELPAGATHVVTARTGLDSAVALGLGYARRATPRWWRHDVLVYGELVLPAGDLDLGDTNLEAGVRTAVWRRDHLGVQLSFGPTLRNTSTNLFAANAIGVHAALLPGYWNQRWGLMAELGFEKMLATHLRHDEMYTVVHYPGATNGWYQNSAGTLRLGIRAGVHVGTLQLSLRAGTQQTERGESHLPPFYATLGAGYAF